MKPIKTIDDLKMMDGSSTSASYMAVARKSNIVLGFKPVVICPGLAMGVPDTTYIGFKIRSAESPKLAKTLDEMIGITALPQKLDVAKAWPELKFSSYDPGNRASVVTGVFLKGDMLDDPNLLTKAVENDGLYKQAYEWLVGACGEENIIAEPEAVIEWLSKLMADPIRAAEAKAQEQYEYRQQLKKNVGVFGAQTDALKKLHQDVSNNTVNKAVHEAMKNPSKIYDEGSSEGGNVTPFKVKKKANAKAVAEDEDDGDGEE